MNNAINPMLLCDFYKTTHMRQFPHGTTKLTSYFTPRMSRLKSCDSVVVFGIQSFCKEYLQDYFNENFFNRPAREVVDEYKRVLNNTLGYGLFNEGAILYLHSLGYLPVQINALPEGTRCPIHVPFLEMTNTHPDFAWVPQFLESFMSSELWHPMVSATVGTLYRDIVDRYYNDTVDDDVPHAKALGDFSFRGQECMQSAIKSSAGWCLSFLNTATVPTIPWLEKYYLCDSSIDPVAYGAVSTEHSVMCSNYAVDGSEEAFLKRLLNELYPNANFSVVSDSYDYWNLVNNIIPRLKEDILKHNGTMLIRGDSGDPIEIVTKTVFRLWEIFGGTRNKKGYKVLNSHVKALYGDSITVQRCEKIFEILKQNGFAANNVSLGVGSFSMQCIEEDGVLKPFTRDTFGMAVKATYAVINGKEIPIFKDPKTDTDHFKKSLKGLCVVYEDNFGDLHVVDGLTQKERVGSVLTPVFRNSEMMKQYTLNEIRQNLWGDKF